MSRTSTYTQSEATYTQSLSVQASWANENSHTLHTVINYLQISFLTLEQVQNNSYNFEIMCKKLICPYDAPGRSSRYDKAHECMSAVKQSISPQQHPSRKPIQQFMDFWEHRTRFRYRLIEGQFNLHQQTHLVNFRKTRNLFLLYKISTRVTLWTKSCYSCED